ncbi:hypothetical protein DERP_002419 [Dermatophagoides pteronyssinus]|uniref:Uncharacterized protein n=1 Tax=Dermatophagoides pteronyssinus TaxID=6956 RepID=A0ABQ8JIB1_DERPT|nr:hypothetical protein DERP_002419 [Dermatophagoides pteronyssinus]
MDFDISFSSSSSFTSTIFFEHISVNRWASINNVSICSDLYRCIFIPQFTSNKMISISRIKSSNDVSTGESFRSFKSF